VEGVVCIAAAGGSLERVIDLVVGVRDADVVYMDVWTLMG